MKTRPLRKIILPTLAALLSLALSGCSARNTPSAAAVPKGWGADPTQASHLGPEIRLNGYAINPPAGYALTQGQIKALDGLASVYVWNGPGRADGTAPQLMITIGMGGGPNSPQMTSAQVVGMSLASMVASHSRAKQSPVESGPLAGIGFSRGYWKGIGPRTGKEFHGVIYAATAPPQIIEAVGKDTTPYNSATLPLMEAAILTLRKL